MRNWDFLKNKDQTNGPRHFFTMYDINLSAVLFTSNYNGFFFQLLSSYKALKPIQCSGMLNHFLPTLSILCYFLPIVYVYALYIFQNVIFPMCLGLSICLLDMGFHLLIFCKTITPTGKIIYISVK